MCKKSFTKRREILSKIPEGVYCYELLNGAAKITEDPFEIILCPYWKSIGTDMAKCKLYNLKDEEPQCLTLLWDQVKLCGLKMPNTPPKTS